ncbi:MAG TPA: hypothetical protein VJO33_03060 [Gemmatimonadaceae bacterium]|nr:hypothetical protein [Gemmatimonadaceae bacterium]
MSPPRDGYGDHVAVDHLAEAHARVESLGHDVQRCLAHREVEPHLRVRGKETGQ